MTVPTWYWLVDDRIHRNLDAGRVVEIVDDVDLTRIESLSRHYTGEPYPVRDRARVDAWVEIEHVHVWGQLRDS